MFFQLGDSSGDLAYLGPFLNPTTGAAVTTLTGMTVYVRKHGGSRAARHATGAITHDGGGYYNVPLDATDLNTHGTLVVTAEPAGAIAVRANYSVIFPQAYSFLFPGELLDVNVMGWAAPDDEDADARVQNLAALMNDQAALLMMRDVFNGTGGILANTTVGTVTNLTNAPQANNDVQSINGSTLAADNLAKAFDGTGYTAAGLNIGAAASVTGTVNANLVAVNATAALMTAFTALMRTVVTGTVVAGTNTTTVVSTGLPATATNFYVGKTLIVQTGTHAGEGGKLVVGYDGATKRLTVEALSGALTAGDTFALVG